jgi:RNA polymerase sigma-70 factor (ECF subfamily)
VQTVGEEFLQGVTDGRTLADDYESSRAGEIINEFLDSQPKADRKIFILRYWFDEDISRIALRTGYSESRIKSLLKRQRDKLRAMLEKEGITV